MSFKVFGNLSAGWLRNVLQPDTNGKAAERLSSGKRIQSPLDEEVTAKKDTETISLRARAEEKLNIKSGSASAGKTMSEVQTRRNILSRAVVDSNYRNELQKDPVSAIQAMGYAKTEAAKLAQNIPNVGRFVNILDTQILAAGELVLCLKCGNCNLA